MADASNTKRSNLDLDNQVHATGTMADKTRKATSSPAFSQEQHRTTKHLALGVTNSFQQTILEGVMEQYWTPFKPEPPMKQLLAELLDLEPSSVDKWFLN
ncbi:hypothetical protein E1B28_003797 [Marasmius oreades]|uniref:Homeobox domain-containing protein n=1 Tax=Marasmius oreades TaxID=181124 RepID=A0A9P7UXB3_9AGAR|nr:uncharacterized protein E1B28_003797 [Marasmius oreades]KAG7096353.1 hypothetical protein E1B28_003797 [Marasmius oreades]